MDQQAERAKHDTTPSKPPNIVDSVVPGAASVMTGCKAFVIGGKVSPLQPGEPSSRPKIIKLSRLKSAALLSVLGVISLVCISWTLWLILLAVNPNKTVNWVMKTENFDDGSFWLMVEAPQTMKLLSLCGLSVVGIAYAVVLVQTFRRQNRVGVGKKSSLVPKSRAKRWQRCELGRGWGRVASFFTQMYQHTIVWQKCADLVVETAVLHVILEDGSPLGLVAILTTIIGMNAFCCAVMMFLPDGCSGLTEVIMDIIFDFLFAVGYPILTGIHCLSSFSLDRAKLIINMEVFPIGSREREATVMADPVQTDIIYKSLKSLQILTIFELIGRVGVLLVFAYRLHSAVNLVKNPAKRPERLYPKRNWPSAALLLLVVVILVVFVEESVRTSARACQPHPECVVKAHRWTIVEKGSLIQCPCRTLIAGDVKPKTFDEWMHPEDITVKVAQLASTGDLRTVKLTNVYFPGLPDEIRSCQQIQYLSLMYTSTQEVPAWTSELVNLEYLFIEGTFSGSLLELPDNMFDKMASLTFIHLGQHVHLQQLPSFNNLHNLKELVLAVLISLAELPEFNSLDNLERLVLSSLPAITTLPDLKSLEKLKSFTVNDRGTWCCNGFLGECNLTDSFCEAQPLPGSSAATCLPSNAKATNATLKVIEKFPDTVCRNTETTSKGSGFPTPDTIAQCSGVMYQKCSLPGYDEAMCYNAGFMAISCDGNPLSIEMRRRQIQQGVGDPCNPVYEAWLGCK